MSTDKRKVTTDALDTLGTIIDENAKRDAIHLAVEPCIAGEILYPGQHIGIFNGQATTKSSKKIGIVDPFISGAINQGQRFWLIIYPRVITSLRHVWSHPDFADEPVVTKELVNPAIAKSKFWIEKFSNSVGLSYDVLMNGAADFVTHGDHISYGGLLEGESVPDEFWIHYQIVTGTYVEANNRRSFFSCSC